MDSLVETVKDMNKKLMQFIGKIEEALDRKEPGYWKKDREIYLQEAFKERLNYLLNEYKSLASEDEFIE